MTAPTGHQHPNAVALTIAGSDPSGGAGLQADLKTFQQLDVYGMSVVTLLTVQNTQTVARVEPMPTDLVLQQLDAVLEDIPPLAIKTGALGNVDLIRAVSQRLNQVSCSIVVDPVLVSKHGHALAGDEVVAAYREHLLPLATLVTPNRFEAERLTGMTLPLETVNSPLTAAAVDPQEQMLADRLLAFGSRYVLLKLGQRDGLSQHLLKSSHATERIAIARLDSSSTHGSGCVLAASITASLAIHASRGESCTPGSVDAAVRFAIEFTWRAINNRCQLGRGIHPTDTRL